MIPKQQHTFFSCLTLNFNSGIFFFKTLTFLLTFWLWLFFLLWTFFLNVYKVFFFPWLTNAENYNDSNNQSSDYQMIRDSLSKRTFLVCYGSRIDVETFLQQNNNKNDRKQKKQTWFLCIFSFGRKWKKWRRMDLNEELANSKDEHLQENNMAARFSKENVDFWRLENSELNNERTRKNLHNLLSKPEPNLF